VVSQFPVPEGWFTFGTHADQPNIKLEFSVQENEDGLPLWERPLAELETLPSPSMHVAQFEGEFVTEMEGRLPAIVMEMPEGYPRGTHLRMNIEVRVKNVRYEENRKGDLVRQHVFALESVQLVSAFAAEEADDSVGGTASGKLVPGPEEAEELGGLALGRTADQWADGAPGASEVDF
jgi:hypothetical protein